MENDFESVLEHGLDLTGIRLSQKQAAQIKIHFTQLRLWNRKMNLTAIREPEQIAEKHFIDCMAACRLLPQGIKVIDLGSGGGFPGIVIKIMNPRAEVVLVDASRKKVNFLKHVIRTAGLDHAAAVHARIETLHNDPEYAGQFDLAVSRAFADLDTFEALAAPLLNRNGILCAMKGPSVRQELSQALRRRYAVQIESYQLPFEKSDRKMVLMRPVRPVIS